MKEILAQYTNQKVSRSDGLNNKECPLCGRVVVELDMERYYEDGSDRSIECCSDCREDFELDSKLSLDSDILSPEVFESLWKYGTENMKSTTVEEIQEGLTEENAKIVARILGGEEWQSGGGIMLILFRRRDGKVVVLSDDVVCEYASDKAFDENKADLAIRFR